MRCARTRCHDPLVPRLRPAWRPDGLLTVVAEGEVWGFRPADSRTVRLLPGRKLRALFDPSLPPGDRRSLEVREVVWLSETHLVAILRREVGAALPRRGHELP